MTHRILLLMSDTGGGHRASAEALQEAFHTHYGDAVSATLVDVFKTYTPYPFNRLPAWYPKMIAWRDARVWKSGFHMSDGMRRTRALVGVSYPYTRAAFKRMLREHPADLYISVHPLLTQPTVRALGKHHPPIVTVVTDLVSTHAFWYYPHVNEIIVPTQGAYERALHNRVAPDKLKVIGLPVSPKFSQRRADKRTLRQELGWQAEPITVLIVGGGEGMGPLAEITRGIAEAGLPVQLAVVCGRNETLRQNLSAQTWPIPVQVYGFARNMPDLMHAADLIVTKAGPSSVMEAANAGLPIILSAALPGQEDGNVRLVVDNNAGYWAPTPAKVVEAVRQLTRHNGAALAQATANVHHIARPRAAMEIVQEVSRFLKRS